MKLSIITVVRNGVNTIGKCLSSVRHQDCECSVEHIVVDGCSDDGTLELVETEGCCVAKVISEPDNGIYDAMNKGISLSSGDVIGILNADDFYASSFVLQRVADLLETKRLDSCYGDLLYVDADNLDLIKRYWVSGGFAAKKFYWGWMPPHPTFFVRRDVYEKYGLFNLDMGTAADYELMLRFLLKHRISCGYMPEILVKMRSGGVSNSSLQNRIDANRMDRKAWSVNGLKPFPWTLTLKPVRKIGQFFNKPGKLP